jgi:hypothetical protein
MCRGAELSGRSLQNSKRRVQPKMVHLIQILSWLPFCYPCYLELTTWFVFIDVLIHIWSRSPGAYVSALFWKHRVETIHEIFGPPFLVLDLCHGVLRFARKIWSDQRLFLSFFLFFQTSQRKFFKPNPIKLSLLEYEILTHIFNRACETSFGNLLISELLNHLSLTIGYYLLDDYANSKYFILVKKKLLQLHNVWTKDKSSHDLKQHNPKLLPPGFQNFKEWPLLRTTFSANDKKNLLQF